MKKFYFLLLLGSFFLGQTSLKGQVVVSRVDITVLDNVSNPIPGAYVMVKGTYVGTVTDLDGKAVLVCRNDAVFKIWAVGFVEVEVPRNSQTDITVVLAPQVLSYNKRNFNNKNYFIFPDILLCDLKLGKGYSKYRIVNNI
jgi:hypothetical protein